MSHFTVAVIAKNKEDIEDMLQPYYEGLEIEREVDEDEEYWYNPDAKWDWYVIGGRWHNILLVKEDCEDIYCGEHSWCNEDSDNRQAPDGYKWTDGAKIKDICFDKMYEIQKENFSTFAMLDDTGWNEKGEMGWFGMDNSTEESTNDFLNYFTKTISKEENKDKYLIIVDCHI